MEEAEKELLRSNIVEERRLKEEAIQREEEKRRRKEEAELREAGAKQREEEATHKLARALL